MILPSISFLLLLSLAKCDPCPKGYTQAPNGGDCFTCKTFYDNFINQPVPTSYDQAEAACNKDGGGMLASIHSVEDYNTIFHFYCGKHWLNIGMKCKGKECQWDDGTPMDYVNFRGDGPPDDGATRCYGIDGTFPAGEWQEHGCGTQNNDCWACRVKARTIECTEDEIEYESGCVSVHSTPLDQKTAEASCPGGGHLVSIHSTTFAENDFYMNLALDAGITGTIYIGGQFFDGVLEWTDGTYVNAQRWANGFPNTFFGTCVQMLLASEFGVAGQWTNVDCSVKQPYICFRDGAEHIKPTVPPHPKADAKCPPIQYFTGTGTIYSPNYPLSIPGQQICEYAIGTKEGTNASVKFATYNCQSGTSLALYDGLNSVLPFITFTTDAPSINQPYVATSNVIKIVFSANGTSAPIGTGWEADFDGI